LYVGILSIAQFLDEFSGRSNIHKTIAQTAIDQAEERKNHYLANHPEAIVMQALLSLIKEDGWYSVYDIYEEVKKYSLKDNQTSDAWVGRLLNGMGIGKSRSDSKRVTLNIKGKVKKLTQYKITRDQIEKLAEKYGIPEDL